MHTVGPRKIFILVGVVCICLVIALFLILDDDHAENYQDISHDRRERSLLNSNEKKVFKLPPNQYVKGSTIVKQNLRKENLGRLKRQVVDPNNYYHQSEPNVRRKRLSEHLQHVKSQFERCRNSLSDKNECEKFYHEMVIVSEALNREIQTMSEIAQSFGHPNQKDQRIFENHGKITQLPNNFGEPFNELNREGQVIQSVNEFTSFPKFHEDLDSHRFQPWATDESNKKNAHLSKPSLPSFRPKTIVASARDNDKITPLKNPSFGENKMSNARTQFIIF